MLRKVWPIATTAAMLTACTAPAAPTDTSFVEMLAARGGANSLEVSAVQANAAARYDLMIQGERIYRAAIRDGYEPQRDRAASLVQPLWIVGSGAAELLRDSVSERAALGERLFLEGAQTTSRNLYFPTEWQSLNRPLRKELSETRLRRLNSMKRLAGPATGATAASGGKPTLAEFLVRARKVNPSVSDADLTAFYAEKYGRALAGTTDSAEPAEEIAASIDAELGLRPAGMSPQAVLQQAKAAIASGKDRAGVIAKVRAMGIDPKGL